MNETPLDGLIKSLKTIDRDLDLLVIDAAERLSDIILDFQKKQLFAGIKGNDEQILPPYTEFTIQQKKKKGLPFDRVTWFDTGELYGNLITERTDTALFIGADDDKIVFLSQKYGSDVLGMTEDNLQKISPEVKNDLLQIILELIKNAKR